MLAVVGSATEAELVGVATEVREEVGVEVVDGVEEVEAEAEVEAEMDGNEVDVVAE